MKYEERLGIWEAVLKKKLELKAVGWEESEERRRVEEVERRYNVKEQNIKMSK